MKVKPAVMKPGTINEIPHERLIRGFDPRLTLAQLNKGKASLPEYKPAQKLNVPLGI